MKTSKQPLQRIQQMIERFKDEIRIRKINRRLDELIEQSRQYQTDCPEFQEIFDQIKMLHLEWAEFEKKWDCPKL